MSYDMGLVARKQYLSVGQRIVMYTSKENTIYHLDHHLV